MIALTMLVVLVVLVVGMASSCAASGAGDRVDGVIETDDAGAMQMNSSDPRTLPVLLNGQDVLSIINEQQSTLVEQANSYEELESALSELQ